MYKPTAVLKLLCGPRVFQVAIRVDFGGSAGLCFEPSWVHSRTFSGSVFATVFWSASDVPQGRSGVAFGRPFGAKSVQKWFQETTSEGGAHVEAVLEENVEKW